jgi:hypothetical protein
MVVAQHVERGQGIQIAAAATIPRLFHHLLAGLLPEDRKERR